MNAQRLLFLNIVLSLSFVFAGCDTTVEKAGTDNGKQVLSANTPPKNAAKPDAPVPVQKADKATPGMAMKSLAKEYEQGTQALMQAIQDKTAASEIEKQATALTGTGVSLIPLIGQKYPQCAAYFEALLQAAPKLTQLSLEAIEKDYHQDGKLPKSPDGSCYHGKDLVVHPATVVILARGGLKTNAQQKSARDELQEVLAHLNAVLQ